MYSKYLKYKNKYLQLKNQDGGAASASTEAVEEPIKMDGEILYPNGDKYIGEYISIKDVEGDKYIKHGKGSLFYNNGDVYEGKLL